MKDNIDWRSLLIAELTTGQSIDGQSADAICSDELSILHFLFRDVIYPPMAINSRNRLSFPEKYSVKMGGGSSIIALLSSPDLFFSIPLTLQKGVLDLLFLILQRDVYDIVRFQHAELLYRNNKLQGINKVLMRLLEQADKSSFDISKRLIHLLGLSSTVGISSVDLKKYLMMLREPSELSLCLLQALNVMIRVDIGAAKAIPNAFFCFGGKGAGLSTSKSGFPFPKEYQISTWFRVESFEDDYPGQGVENSSDLEFNTEDNYLQHIIAWKSVAAKGVLNAALDVYIEKHSLTIAILSQAKADPTILKVDNIVLKKGVWYHLSIRHSKPKLSFFSNDELVVFLDQQVILVDNCRFPNLSGQSDVEFFIGKNFDGQMGPVYFFNEVLSPVALQTIARVDAGRTADGVAENIDSDLLKSITTADRKVHPISSKVSTSFHPSRCGNGFAIDIHGGRHASLGKLTEAVTLSNPREIFNSLGGIECILLLFPRLLLESETSKPSSTGQGDDLIGSWEYKTLGTSINDTGDSIVDNYLLDKQVVTQIQSRKEDFSGDGCISVLLAILSKIISNSRQYQKQLLQVGGIEMIEYALSFVPQYILQQEGEKCVFSLMQLRKSSSDFTILELRVCKSLLCNLKIWCGGSYQLLSSLLSIVLSSLKARADLAVKLIDLNQLLDALMAFFPIVEGLETGSSANSFKISPENENPPSLSTDKPNSGINFVSSNSNNETGFYSPNQESGDATPEIRSSRTSSRKSASRKMKNFKLALTESFHDEPSEINDVDTEGANSIQLPLKPIIEHEEIGTLGASSSDNLDMSAISNSEELSNHVLSNIDLGISFKAEKQEQTSIENDIEPGDIFSPVDNSQRKQLREYILSILAVILLQLTNENDVLPFINFIAVCKDYKVLSEMCNLVSFLIIETGTKFLSLFISSLGGVDEFLAFVVVYFIHQPYEELRCGGLRLVALLSQRLDQLTPAILSLTSRKKKYRAMSNIQQRLHECGALALLCEVLSSHARSSTALTYSALLELLLSTDINRGTISVSNLLLDPSISGYRNSGLNSKTALDLTSDSFDDNADKLLNTFILPIFFELLPKFPLSIQDQMYTDLLVMVKHHSGTCQAFCDCPSWHLCMYGLVAQLIGKQHDAQDFCQVSSFDISELLRQSTAQGLNSPSVYSSMGSRKDLMKKNSSRKLEVELLRRWNNSKSSSFESTAAAPPPLKPSTSKLSILTDIDLQFDLGMKVYSTLLLHVMDSKFGWREVDRSVAPALDSEEGYLIGQCILSHLMNELTFNMKSRYKEIQRMMKSNNSLENQSGADRLENLLSVMMTASHVALMDQNCVTGSIANFEICKLRVHNFYLLLSRSSSSEQDSAVRSLSKDSSSREVESSSAGDTGNPDHEIREILFEVESLLRQKFFEGTGVTLDEQKLLDEDDIVAHEFHFSELMDTVHDWYSFAGEGPQSRSRSSSDMDSPVSSPMAGNANNTKSKMEELLHPLGRFHDYKEGKMTLVLQALRFFDSIFFDDSKQTLRNLEMLRFIKESQGTLVSISSTRRVDSQRSSQISLFGNTLRMSLFTLNNLSPASQLSVVNTRRLLAIVQSLDKIPSYNTASQDWLVVIVIHTTMHLQRLVRILEPVFAMLGIRESPRIPTVGPWVDSYDDFDTLDPSIGEAIFATIENEPLLIEVEESFNSSYGRNILRNIRVCLQILVSAFESQNSKICSSLEERIYRSLWVLVEQIKADLQVAMDNESEVADSSRFMMDDALDDSMMGDGDINGGGRSAATPASPGSPVPILSKLRLSGTETRVESPFPTNGTSTNTKSTAKSFRRVDSSNLLNRDDAFDGPSIIMLLKWLRYPYFSKNPLRSIQVIKILDSLDNLEAKSVFKFTTDTKQLKQSLEDHRDLAIKSVEEMTELKGLSREVHESILERYQDDKEQVSAERDIRTKAVANRWSSCIRLFEADWSPWRNEYSAPAPDEFKDSTAYYELSKHRDFKLRNMVLTRVSEPINHEEAAYLDSKVKDQMRFASASSAGSNDALATVAKAKAPSNAPFNLSLIAVRDVKGPGAKTWGDEDDEGEADLDRQNPFIDPRTLINYATSGDINAALGEVSKSISTFFLTNEKRPLWTHAFLWAADEKMLFMSDVNLIQLDQVVTGTVVLSNKSLYFHYKKRIRGLERQTAAHCDRKWHLDRLVEAYGRRYLLQTCAIELFFADAPDLFLAFKSFSELQKFFRILRNQSTPMLTTPKTLNPRSLFRNSPWTEMWRRRLISNFEYLMRLNVLAGRSYNDITQYPVFPWIIADYSSEHLDLTSPATFRPLNLPVGALNPARLGEFLDRYRTFDDDTVPKFMYGSHYSSAGVVMHYLVRQEPFTTLAIQLQSGRFDCPDRIFFDIARTWQGCNHSMSDVKELIPELFCCPEALLNTNRLPLGELQDGDVPVSDVVLPPWAKTAFDFIRINREALESEFVSEHLHEWIDLIFGFKQTGPAAVAANNVFYYLTYENAIDIEAIEDPLEREAAKAQVTHFGQTPSQLLTKEHPRRLPRDECVLPLGHDLSSAAALRGIQLFTPAAAKQAGRGGGPVVGMKCVAERLVVMHGGYGVSQYRWTAFPDSDGAPFTVRTDKSRTLPSAALSVAENLLKGAHVLNPAATAMAMGMGTVSRANRAETAATILSRSVDFSEREPDSDSSNCASPDRERGAEREQQLLQQSALSPPPPLLSAPLSASASGESASVSVSPSPGPPVTPPKGFFEGLRSKISLRGFGGSGKETSSPSLYSAATDRDSAGIYNSNASSSKRFSRPLSSSLSVPSSVKARLSSITPIHCLSAQHVALSLSETSSASRVVTVGYWDNTVKVHSLSLDSLKEVASVSASHCGAVTCVQLGAADRVMLTGGADGTLRVWVLEKPSLAAALSPEAFHGEFVGEEFHPLSSSPGATLSASLSASASVTASSASAAGSAASAGTSSSAAAASSLVDGSGGSSNAFDTASSASAGAGAASSSVSSSSGAAAHPLVCLHTLCGHFAPITAVSYCSDLDLSLSADSDGLLCLHEVRQGRYLRSVRDMQGSSVDAVQVSQAGYLIAHSHASLQLCSFWVNGALLASVVVADPIEALACSASGALVICGDAAGTVSFREAWGLRELHRLALPALCPVSFLGFSEDQQYLLIGAKDGSFSVAADPDARWKLINAAVQKAPLLLGS